MTYVMTSKQARRVMKAGLNLGDICNRINRHNNAADVSDMLPTFPEARNWAKRSGKATVELLMAADDSLELVRFGPRGGFKRLTKLTPCSE